ncbi:CRISPR-associated endonuclease Cas2 [Christensenella tenuis]|uniref:CRISPR-associated endoribonuclease Cas2 n=1 Tax=Christensenella tenuis TaxID=2763033 RepID=A0ABR7EE90_9FIRM|nr:CRISPR-associated endonuclease Cas2 [Christensenella tenuis]MBC5648107.1 CRISPR-associated endonuclease Cas2 [Christensenella tenuis]
MLVLLTYDVSTDTAAGRRRLARVARKCLSYGQRVQNSVFECNIDWSQFLKLQNELKGMINTETDSLRFYNLGNHYSEKVIHVGAKPSIDLEGDLIL